MSHLVERQLGHVTRGQLLELGFSSSWIRGRLRTRWLIAVHAGVYAVGHVPRHPLARAFAALLACGEGAALSHATAAAYYGVGAWPRLPEVTAPAERRRPGIRTHRTIRIEARVRDGLRVTTPARTVRDLAPRLTDARLIRLVNDLRVAGHLRAGALAALRREGLRVDRLLGDRDDRPTRSAFEDLYPAFAARHGLPPAELNAILPENGREVDALHRDARLIVELDSWLHHGDRAAFERDRRKDAQALALGYRTLRITYERLTRGGDAEANTIRRILSAGDTATRALGSAP